MRINIDTLKAIVAAFLGLATIAGLMSAFNSYIDAQIDDKINNPQFIKQLALQLRSPFVIFDEDEKFLYDSGTEPYIDNINVVKENDNIKQIMFTGKKFFPTAPIIQALDGKLQFSETERVGKMGWRYKAFYYQYSGVSRSEGRPADRFRIDIIE